MRHVHEIENVFLNGHGNLEVICGPMFSGKTEELIRRIRRVEYAKLRAIVFKPRIDSRFSKDLVVSHSDQKIQSIPVADASSIRACLEEMNCKFHVVGLDEVQFFDEGVVALCEELVNSGVRVIAAGLCEDYLGEPFGPMPRLLAHADTVSKLWAICMNCGRPASKTQRVAKAASTPSVEQVFVSGGQHYQARCRACHQKKVLRISAEE